MNLFADAFDELTEILEASERGDGLTVDQQLKVAEIKALLSISQELSKIHHHGINPDYN
ncbi:hypothetical protein [Micromonospora sp. NPDC049891]|uniref:hypothetical protein n=1 Tax=Micromonospora sp. NPDC049891 TaxID=3155655 RepID=UPI0033C7259A